MVVDPQGLTHLFGQLAHPEVFVDRHGAHRTGSEALHNVSAGTHGQGGHFVGAAGFPCGLGDDVEVAHLTLHLTDGEGLHAVPDQFVVVQNFKAVVVGFVLVIQTADAAGVAGGQIKTGAVCHVAGGDGVVGRVINAIPQGQLIGQLVDLLGHFLQQAQVDVAVAVDAQQLGVDHITDGYAAPVGLAVGAQGSAGAGAANGDLVGQIFAVGVDLQTGFHFLGVDGGVGVGVGAVVVLGAAGGQSEQHGQRKKQGENLFHGFTPHR